MLPILPPQTSISPAGPIGARRTLPKSPTGIAGLDEVTGGGLPRGRPTLVCGPAGCGKTLLALEFLMRGISQYGEAGVFVSFEESVLTAQGIELADVYVGPQGVLTGSARQAQEAKERSDSAARLEDLERRRVELVRRRESVEAQTASLWREYEDEAQAVELLLSSGSTGTEDRAGQRAEQGRLRRSDSDEVVESVAAQITPELIR